MAPNGSSTTAVLANIRLPKTFPPYLASLALVGLSTVIYRDYSAWYALGRGGVPHNIIGYTLQSALGWLFGEKDLVSTECFDKVIEKENDDFAKGRAGLRTGRVRSGSVGYGPHPKPEPVENKSWIQGGELPMRVGARPEIGKWYVPQRMIDESASEEMRNACKEMITTLASKNANLLTSGPSQIECGSPGLFLSPALVAPGVHDLRFPTNPPPHHRTHPGGPSEMFHVHDAEGSMHALVNAKDAKEIASKGWGIRHGLAGKRGTPWGYMLIFAPRNSEELGTIKRIVEAAAYYALEGRGGELKW
ncbi:MAG: hypothetical protein M1828_000826 [Chrysothrix sp. TS-e1954]|nr:MAG: hypothetical protein M1828_000826 [Chrysothrix sp. TS-e1954]